MTQASMTIQNAPAPQVRQAINDALRALASFQAGPAEPVETMAYMQWLDTTNETVYQRSPSDDAWITIGRLDVASGVFRPAFSDISPGMMMLYGGDVAPGDFFFCEPVDVSRSIYSDLHAAIGTTFGEGDGSTTFGLPNFHDNVVMGAGPTYPNGTEVAESWKSFYMTNTIQNGGINSGYDHSVVYMGKSTSAFVGRMFTGQFAIPATAIGTRWDGSPILPNSLASNIIIRF